MDDQTTKEITAIQEEALRAMGCDPYELRKQVAIENEEANKPFNGDGTFSLHKLKANWVENGLLEEDIPAAISKYVEATVPEKLYFDEEEYLVKIMGQQRTQYDKYQFLTRFANIEGLCHEYFTSALSVPELSIRLSSLPFTQINGVSFYTSNRDRVVLLNEAFLYCVPELLKGIRPGLRLKKFHDVLDKYRGVEIDEEKVTSVVEQVNSLLEQRLPTMIGMLIDIMSGRRLTFETFGYSEDGPISMTVNNLGMPPTAFETWKFDEEYFNKLHDETDVDVDTGYFGELEYIRPKKADFLAVQGFFTLVVGHEFSHFYRDHHSKRKKGKMLRPLEQIQEEVNFLRNSHCDPRFTMADINSKEFFISQPTEAEADADGLKCVLKYCEDNSIGGEDFDSVIVGALSAFYFMEMMDRIHHSHEYGLGACMDFIRTPAHFRNCVFPSEHPYPMSRVDEAIRHSEWSEKLEAQKAAIVDIWEDLALSLDWQWITFADQIYSMMQQAPIAPKSKIDRSRLFKKYSAVGCFDSMRSVQPG